MFKVRRGVEQEGKGETGAVEAGESREEKGRKTLFFCFPPLPLPPSLPFFSMI